MRLGPLAAVLLAATALVAAPRTAAARDDTTWLQAKLDAGGSVFLPKLPNGECYSTRGLWVSRDDTSVTSDGACIVGLGFGRRPGPGPRPWRAKAVFLLDHTNIRAPRPVRVAISGVDIRVPAKAHMAGIEIYGHEVTLEHVSIGGAPRADVVIGSGAPGAGGLTARVAIRDCMLSAGQRDVIVASGPIGLRIERSSLAGGRGAGLHIRAGDRGQPTLDVRVTGNRIVDNAGPGILLDLAPKNGLPVFASGLELAGNTILRNARKAPATRRGGIVLAGGQRDGQGGLLLTDNVVGANSGPGILGRNVKLVVTATGNDLRGNRGGAAKDVRFSAAAGPATTRRR